jgi:23S rRNA (uridine2552-2'-O)-methyltransferase
MTHHEFKAQDHYNKSAKWNNYVARSIYKLEEIDNKYNLIDKNCKKVLDIWCSPGSRLQYVYKKIGSNPWFLAVWLDIQQVKVNLKWVETYVVDATDHEACEKIIIDNQIEKFDVILSDLAPNTIGFKDIDAMRCIWVLEWTLWLYENYLKPNGRFAMKIFMWPGFDEFVANCKKIRWASNVKLFKPKACRDNSKEIYIVKWR